ncbi:uncharacterized protein LOC134549262 [Prinia subflava]|uniref:uncharacterized protein LOC134549262 n=1 Tax=Prinia subflava TaxID=208062 RepID=UPI002FE2E4A6
MPILIPNEVTTMDDSHRNYLRLKTFTNVRLNLRFPTFKRSSLHYCTFYAKAATPSYCSSSCDSSAVPQMMTLNVQSEKKHHMHPRHLQFLNIVDDGSQISMTQTTKAFHLHQGPLKENSNALDSVGVILTLDQIAPLHLGKECVSLWGCQPLSQAAAPRRDTGILGIPGSWEYRELRRTPCPRRRAARGLGGLGAPLGLLQRRSGWLCPALFPSLGRDPGSPRRPQVPGAARCRLPGPGSALAGHKRPPSAGARGRAGAAGGAGLLRAGRRRSPRRSPERPALPGWEGVRAVGAGREGSAVCCGTAGEPAGPREREGETAAAEAWKGRPVRLEPPEARDVGGAGLEGSRRALSKLQTQQCPLSQEPGKVKRQALDWDWSVPHGHQEAVPGFHCHGSTCQLCLQAHGCVQTPAINSEEIGYTGYCSIRANGPFPRCVTMQFVDIQKIQGT